MVVVAGTVVVEVGVVVVVVEDVVVVVVVGVVEVVVVVVGVVVVVLVVVVGQKGSVVVANEVSLFDLFARGLLTTAGNFEAFLLFLFLDES